MANTWDIADDTLQAMLEAYLSSIASDPDWDVHLYSNDFSPGPGTVIGDFTECTFNGYSAQPLVTADWGSVSVTDHVAISTYPTPIDFTAASSGFSSQNVYGYYVTDGAGDLLFSERFESTRVVFPLDVLSVQPVLRHTTYPP